MLPVSVIDKPLEKRMASTVRHNRARGSHNVDLMSNIVRELHELGRSDAWISKHLGMDRDEILRLKQITGLSALFRDVKFGSAWIPADDSEMFEGPMDDSFFTDEEALDPEYEADAATEIEDEMTDATDELEDGTRDAADVIEDKVADEADS